MAIEWVARSQKPIVEIGGCPVNGHIRALAHDLNRCIAMSGESVQAFVIPDGLRGYCCYGFYRYPWTIEALIFIWGTRPVRIDSRHLEWIHGLVFGYSPDAIQSFMSSASSARASKSHSPQHTESRRVCLGRVGIYGYLASSVRPRSSRSDKRQRHD